MQNKMEKVKDSVALVQKAASEVFSIFLIAYLFFFLLDEIFDDFISNFFNLNYILVIVLVSGFLTMFLQSKCEREVKSKDLHVNKKWQLNLILSIGLGIIACFAIFYKLQDISMTLIVIISILSGLLIGLISYLFLSDNVEEI